MIETAAISRLARGSVPDGWEDDFAGMVSYAKSRGWLADAGAAIQAHVDWLPTDGAQQAP